MQPAIFFGHGSPMNALERNAYTQVWERIGRELPRPRAILAISAHWYVPGTRATAAEWPATIHDFGGFPPALFAVQYPAPGDPALARRLQGLLAPVAVTLDTEWGLDHGVWSVLVHLFPQADIPVVQLSLDSAQPPEFFLTLGERLRTLRDEGILVMGSGNVVHNLTTLMLSMRGRSPQDGGACERFEQYVRDNVAARSFEALVHFEQAGPDAHVAVPDIDHYLPLLPVLGTASSDEPIAFPTSGLQAPGISMLSVRVG